MTPNRLFSGLAGLLLIGLWAYGQWATAPRPPHRRPPGTPSPGGRRVLKTDAQWRTQLTDDQYDVLQCNQTEWPGSSDLLTEHRPGTYACAGCRAVLFSAETKFESRTGWPSFYAPARPDAVYTEPDGRRTEVRCAVCDGHLGHVFADGPAPTGLRYCLNGTALLFRPQNSQ